MARRFGLGLAVCAAMLCAEHADPPELVRAREERERITRLVNEGALPRSALEQSERALEEAGDQVVLRRTLYGPLTVEEMTEEQAVEMLAAAQRLLDRQKVKLEHAKKLAEQGVLARAGLTPYLEELDRRRKTFDLATSRARLLRELAEMARAEESLEAAPEDVPAQSPKFADRYDGDGVFHTAHLRTIVLAFEREFGRPLPVSAHGATALHRSLGFDHRGRIDVALSPDHPEGVWLRRFLEQMRVPYFAFWGYLRGKSTAAHIHIGPPSLRLRSSD